MKKAILALFIFGAVALAPIAKADTLGFGITPELIQQAQQDPEFKAVLITYMQTIIKYLQQQLIQIAQNTTPEAGNNAQIQNIMPEEQQTNPFEFTPNVFHYPGSLAMSIAEKFDKCTLIIKDENGKVVRNQDAWMNDKDGNSRQVYSMGTQGQHTYEVTCSKGGFDTTTKTGNFPLTVSE
jgi:hypothetical protein